MVKQSLTLQWQEAAIRGYDPNRHGLENPETERAKDLRNRLHNKDRFEQNFGEYSRKNGDGALDFERADQMAGAGYWQNRLNDALEEYENAYKKAQESINSAYRQLEQERQANELQREELYMRSIVLSDGKRIFTGENGTLYYENGEQVTDENEIIEAEAIQQDEPGKDWATYEDAKLLNEQKQDIEERTQKVDAYAKRVEARNEKKEELEKQREAGEISDKEYVKAVEAINDEMESDTLEMGEEKAQYEAVEKAKNETSKISFSSYSSDMSRTSFAGNDGQGIANSGIQRLFNISAAGTAIAEKTEQHEFKPANLPTPV